MGLLSFLFRPFAQAQLARTAETDGPAAAIAALRESSSPGDARLWLEVANRLSGSGRHELAAEILSAAPNTAEVLEARAASTASTEEARALLEQAVAQQPRNEGTAAALADQLLNDGENERAIAVLEPFGDSIGPETAALLGEALFGLERFEEALRVIRPHVLAIEADARSILSVGLGKIEAAQRLRDLHDELVSILGGAEALTVDLAARGQLDPRSAHNHRLLSKRLMLDQPRLAPVLDLRSADETRSLGEALKNQKETEATALVQLGQVALRRCDPRGAQALFAQALERSPTHFGAALGEAVALDFLQRALVARVEALPVLAPPPGIEQVIADWNALLPLERRVVAASVAPLAWMLPTLIVEGCQLRILPLDVRPTDLPELSDLRDSVVEGDHRSWEGIEGLAGSTLAVAKVESLYDVTPAGWTLAHEFAHLCELRLPAPARATLDALYERALEAEYAFEQYALQNVHEFFAVNYQHALCERYGIRLEREHDQDGLLREAIGLYATPR